MYAPQSEPRWPATATGVQQDELAHLMDPVAGAVLAVKPALLHRAADRRVKRAAGIGRATLYSYFPDVEHILLAWHEQEVDRYRESLSEELARQSGTPDALLTVVTRLIEGFTGGHDQAVDASRVELGALSPEIKRQMVERRRPAERHLDPTGEWARGEPAGRRL